MRAVQTRILSVLHVDEVTDAAKRYVGLVIMVCSLFFWNGCSSDPYSDIAEHIEGVCGEDGVVGCSVSLREVFDSEWDTMYVFYPDASGELMREVTGLSEMFVRNSDSETRLLFVKDRELVLSMTQSYEPLKTVSFVWGRDEREYGVITSERAEITVLEVLDRPNGGIAYLVAPQK